MALKPKISTAEYGSLNDAMKSVYVQIDGSDEYQLDVEGFIVDQDPKALLQAKNHEKKARQEAEAKLAEIERQKLEAEEQAEQERLRKKGDMEALERRWSEKAAKERQELQDQIDRQSRVLANQMLDAHASQLASELSGENAQLMLPHVRSRMTVEFENGEPKLKVLDEQGQISLNSLQDLKKSMLANKQFAPIIVQSQATGGSSGAAGRVTSGNGQAKKFNDYSGAELKEIRKSNPAEYDRLVKERDTTRPTF